MKEAWICPKCQIGAAPHCETCPNCAKSLDLQREPLFPDNKVWNEIDAMLHTVWAKEDKISLEEETKKRAEMLDAIRKSEIRQFEELYGETS